MAIKKRGKGLSLYRGVPKRYEAVELSAAQTSAANADTAWVTGGALLFFPVMAVAAAGPDHADEIASLKGQRNALREQTVASGC
ncbi:hypothetical protein [Roseovarius nitratireducens]|uniref:hypothetical protein n=1 Tax=Roseovarius nitratireducens TaxID=2044597 RepID=UPI00101ADBF8|nr:hypothetical protein [Roseovarius nitratireducens]